MNVFWTVFAAAVLSLCGCKSSLQLSDSEVANVNEYCSEAQSETNIATGKALIERLTRIAKEPLERDYKMMGISDDHLNDCYEFFKNYMGILRDNCGRWPKTFPGIPIVLNYASLQTLYESMMMSFEIVVY